MLLSSEIGQTKNKSVADNIYVFFQLYRNNYSSFNIYSLPGIYQYIKFIKRVVCFKVKAGSILLANQLILIFKKMIKWRVPKMDGGKFHLRNSAGKGIFFFLFNDIFKITKKHHFSIFAHQPGNNCQWWFWWLLTLT